MTTLIAGPPIPGTKYNSIDITHLRKDWEENVFKDELKKGTLPYIFFYQRATDTFCSIDTEKEFIEQKNIFAHAGLLKYKVFKKEFKLLNRNWEVAIHCFQYPDLKRNHEEIEVDKMGMIFAYFIEAFCYVEIVREI